MYRTLALKVVKDRWRNTLYYAAGLAAYMLMLAAIFPSFRKMKGIEEFLEQYPEDILKLFGAADANLTSFNNYVTVEFLGLIAVVIIGAYVFTFARSMVSGELREGTLELLLTQPVSRSRVLFTECAVMFAGILALVLAIVASAFAFGTAFGIDISYRGFLSYVPLAFALFFSVGGYALFLSVLWPRRGVMAAVGLTFALYMLNFAAQVSAPARGFRYFSIFHYYNPSRVLESGAFPARDVLVLLGVGAFSYLLGGLAFTRKDIAPG